MPGRYGQPAGFGGGYTQPTRGEFQPGSEVGVVDPNEGRYYVCIAKPSGTTHASATKPIGARHFAASTPQMNPGCSS